MKSEIANLVEGFYKDETGKPIILAPGQEEIFSAIANKESPRVQIMCHTRYGKSLTVALAVLTRAVTFAEKWTIVAGTKEKAKIIMSYINQHIFDNDYVSSRFIFDKGETKDYIKRHRNKNHISFLVGKNGKYDLLSEVKIVSAKDALGEGSPNVVEDESALIPDTNHSFVMRMLGDNPEDNFLCKIGNPFTRGHFLKSHNDPAYKKINIDCYRSLKEGRINQEMIDENKPYIFFPVLYENRFPGEEEIDEKGWLTLITENEIDEAQKREVESYGTRRLGLDVARGGRNYNVWVLRTDNMAKVVKRNNVSDLMKVADITAQLSRELNVRPAEIYVDDTGVGGGVTDRLYQLGMKVNAIKLGETESMKIALVNDKHEKAEDYLNVRAYCYTGRNGVSAWLKRGGMLVPDNNWSELTRIRYKKQGDKKTMIEPKEQARKRGEESPDVADAFAITFAPKRIIQYRGLPDPAEILRRGGDPQQNPAGGVGQFIPGIG
jgi:hypothetical protein